jgi:hypothetical protein
MIGQRQLVCRVWAAAHVYYVRQVRAFGNFEGWFHAGGWICHACVFQQRCLSDKQVHRECIVLISGRRHVALTASVVCGLRLGEHCLSSGKYFASLAALS